MGCDYSAEDKQLHGSTTALLRFAVICPDRCATRPALILLRSSAAAACSNSFSPCPAAAESAYRSTRSHDGGLGEVSARVQARLNPHELWLHHAGWRAGTALARPLRALAYIGIRRSTLHQALLKCIHRPVSLGVCLQQLHIVALRSTLREHTSEGRTLRLETAALCCRHCATTASERDPKLPGPPA